MSAPIKGNRKLSVNRETACFLTLGFALALAAAGWFRLDTATCVQGFAIFTAGLVGKDAGFMWANAKEYEHTKPSETPK